MVRLFGITVGRRAGLLFVVVEPFDDVGEGDALTDVRDFDFDALAWFGVRDDEDEATVDSVREASMD